MKRGRGFQTEEEKEIKNEKAKERMKKLRLDRKVKKATSLEKKVPDIVEKLNQINRIDKEKKRKIDFTQRGSDSSKEANTEEEIGENKTKRPTKKEKLEEYKNKQKVKQKERNQRMREKVEAAKKLLPPLPSRELCLYEQIRADNIAQREREWEIYKIEWEKKLR